MKNLSEVAVGLAYSSLVFRDRSLAAEVRHLEDRLDEMKIRLELWVLRAAGDDVDPKPLRGLLHLAAAAEDLGDQAQQMVWLVEKSSELHPVLQMALGDTDDVVVRLPVAAGRRPSVGPSATSSSRSSPASPCWPSSGTAATSTGPGATSSCGSTMPCWPAVPRRVGRPWPRCWAGASSSTRRTSWCSNRWS